ncbi:MAG: 16S rRNA (cytosine(1402)-N(4))-methyltransferase RsmH [Verrucomicrobiota bacterium]
MNFLHVPVLRAEVLEWLRVAPGGVWVDGTAGGGGHGEAILEASSPTGLLWACDQDGDAVAAASARWARFGDRVRCRRMNFAELAGWVPPGQADGVLLDLGVSSHQLETAERGFSFQRDGPLDMRMDRRAPVTAAVVVNEWPEAELARVLWEYGDEPAARRIARAVVEERGVRRMETTGQLAGLVGRVVPWAGQRTHPATRTFQALRLVVNRELELLPGALAGAAGLLRPGGRLAVITFHSGEDRRVKEFMRAEARDYDVPGGVDIPELRVPRAPRGRVLTRRPVEPTEAEVAANPRARSARLRVMERL